MSAEPFDPALPVYHAAWKAGDLPTDVLREHLVWIYSLHGFPDHAALALEMFAATGYVTDSPSTRLPATLTLYRAQLDGTPMGTSWTARYDSAAFYASMWADSHLPRVILTGRAARCDVLMWRRPDAEIVVDPGAVCSIRPARPTTRIHPWAAITHAEARRKFQDVMDAQRQLLLAVTPRWAAAPALYDAVRADYRMSYQACLVWGI